MTRALLPLLVVLALATASEAQEVSRSLDVEARSRIALVIGNADYQHAASLVNPTNDAEDIAAALSEVGFAVRVHTDLSHEAMGVALSEFTAAATGAEVALFYYAGHGVQVDGENFLVPVDADISSEAQMRYRSLPLGEVMASIDASDAQLKAIFLDACRDNPFQSWRSSSAGLAQTYAPSGSIVVYATGPGRRASDNQEGRNGLFTAALLEEVRTPGLELSRLVRNVRGRVLALSGGRQEPWQSSSYVNDFYFVPPTDASPGSPQPVAPAVVSVPVEATREDRRGQATALDARVASAPPPDSLLVSSAARSVWEAAASGGHPEAQSVLGWVGLVKEDVNDNAVITRLRAAAERGHPAAQTNLAFAYLNGLGVQRDLDEAARLYARASDQDRAVAQNGLGMLYETGQGVEQDLAQAAKFYALAADQGLVEASINLAQLLEADNPWRAADLYEEAALDGHAIAMTRLATLYERGVGVPQSDALARTWRRRAAVLGEPHALAWVAAQAAAEAAAASEETVEEPNEEPEDG